MPWHPEIPEEYRNQIVAGDCRELAKRLPDESIDLIFTDPQYSKEYLPLYEWLGIEAKRILKPAGFLLAYAGVYWKKEVFRLISQSMEYYWDFVLVNTGNSPIMWKRKIISRYKSIVAWTKYDTNAMPRCNVLGMWNGSGEDKRFHTWGQDESSARYYVDCFSRIPAVVLDPFVGGGTTPAVCKMLNRNYIAFEIDPQTADIARRRVLYTNPPLPFEKPHQERLIE